MGKRIVVVGGGPAGMAAALAAAADGAEVTLLEKRPKLGKKLLATGNGRCNLAHDGPLVYFGGVDFARRAVAVPQVLRQLQEWGLALYTDPEGRVYPATQQAATVMSVLTAQLRRKGITVVPDAEVLQAAAAGTGFTVTTAEGRTYPADALILATGGLAGGNLGNRQEDYSLAAGFGHRVTELFGGLAPLELELGRYKRLSGLRMPVIAQLISGEHRICASAGEALFTDYGISGICIMQLARDARGLLSRGIEPELKLDLSPVFFPDLRSYRRIADVPETFERTLDLLKSRKKQLGADGMLTGLIPDSLAAFCPAGDPRKAAAFLTGLRLRLTGVRPMAQSQITCGGVDAREIDPGTMASRLVPGLYFAGEMIDVDGDCGGYNLQFAFATGLTAGHSAARND